MWELQFGDLKEGERFDPKIHAAAEKALREEGVTIRNLRKREMSDEVRRFSDVYNEAWGDNWGFVPITDAEVEFQAKNLKQVIDEEWAFMAEKDGEVIGAALTLPDINQVMAKMGGRLLPFGWLRFLLGKRKIDQLRVFALGVKNDYRHTGGAARPLPEALETAAGPGRSRRRHGLDPGDERAHEPRDEGDGRRGRQALPARSSARSAETSQADLLAAIAPRRAVAQGRFAPDPAGGPTTPGRRSFNRRKGRAR